MSPFAVTWRRTVGRSRNCFSTVLTLAGFFSAAALMFSFALRAAEGARITLPSLLATSVSPILPVLASFLAMDVWSDERRTGRLEMLLTIAVPERSFVIGKFFGLFSIVAAAVVAFFAEMMVLSWFFAPSVIDSVSLPGLVLPLLILFVQSAAWCAAAEMFSAMFSQSAASVCLSLACTVLIPRGLWVGMIAWLGERRVALGEMPFDAHVADFSSGVVSVGTLMAYLLAAGAMLFVCSKSLASLRLVGRGSATARAATRLASCLAVVFAVLGVILLVRVDTSFDLQITGSGVTLSPRTRSLLVESSGDVSVICFLPRSDRRFRSVGQLLRSLKRQSESLGGPRFTLNFVDMRWDLGAAERLVRTGVRDPALVFEKGGRRVVLPLSDGYGERVVASALRRLVTPMSRRSVCWTIGHGESSPSDYGTFGMSDIARDVVREGFQNVNLDLSSVSAVPTDCALVVVAGARQDFSRVELGRLDAYLREGGRMLALLDASSGGGLESLLSTWGVRAVARPILGSKTLSGSDVIVSEFSDHPVSKPLKGSRIVLERPVTFEPTAAVEAGVGADRIGFTSVATFGSSALVASVERGAGAGGDLALRPTRIVAIGDATFAMNGSLSARANANRDFFLNCISFLSGTDASGSVGAEAGLMAVGLDRDGWLKLVVTTAVGFPLLATVILLMGLVRRRNRR